MDWAIDCDQDILYQQSRKKREEANRLRVVNWFISLVSFGILILLLSLSYAMIMAPTMTYFMMTLVIIILIGIFSMLVKYVSSTNRKAPEVANTDKK
jgi:L-asparagine transporter-like permease